MDDKTLFEQLNNGDWNEVISDSGKEDWRKNWFLDGKEARVFNGEKGMEFYTGPRFGVDADHGVLWTKRDFHGDVKLTFDYTRLDDADRCVCIVYLLATGICKGPYTEDIYDWRELREVPAMKAYFNNMNLYHISFSVFQPNPADKYIRARRYCGGELEGTDIAPDYFPDDLFAPMVPHKITVIKKGLDLFLHVTNAEAEKLCHWKLDPATDLTHGRIGLRQMYTRNSRYANLKLYEGK